MHLFDLVSLISAAFAGATMGSFLLLSLLHKPFISQLEDDQHIDLHRRFYRLNTVLALLAGLAAALVNNQQAALVLATLAASYVFANMHILKGQTLHLANRHQADSQRALKSLSMVQNMLHFFQFIGAGWGIYFLN